MPKISVIMAAYNCEDFIEESIRSILDQSFSDFELIIINDGSVDNTHKIITDIIDPRIKYINNTINSGVLAVSKEAISLASSKYIAIQDADDVSFPDRLRLQLEFLEGNSNIFCVGGYAKKIGMSGEFIGDWNFPPIKHADIVSMLALQRKCPIINPSSMFCLKEYRELGGYSPDNQFLHAHDFDFWCRAILAGKQFSNLPEYLIKYRVNTKGITRGRKFKQLVDYTKIMNSFLKRIHDGKLQQKLD